MSSNHYYDPSIDKQNVFITLKMTSRTALLERLRVTMGEPDELYTLRNLFWMGNFQLAINEAGCAMCPPIWLQRRRVFAGVTWLWVSMTFCWAR